MITIAERLRAESSGCSCGFVHCAVNSWLIMSTCVASRCVLIDPGHRGFWEVFYYCVSSGLCDWHMPNLCLMPNLKIHVFILKMAWLSPSLCLIQSWVLAISKNRVTKQNVLT